MKNQYTVVFSGWRATNDLVANMEASKEIRAHLDELNLAHWDAIGAFKEDGQDNHTQEVSHVVHCSEDDIHDLMTYALHVHNQDCVLVIKSDDNTARLEYPHDSVDLGKLYKVDEQLAKHNGAYTYFLGEYFICSHELQLTI